ncbi:MAG: radical SAM protein [Oscillospiraceae bacterium]|jgi:uncharacterized protein|nr:radical SAM protein [Oscillospiraceae bacterium]
MNSVSSAYIEITGSCNAKCPYCYNEKLVNGGGELSLDTLISLFSQLKSSGINKLSVSGGEPFLHTDIRGVFREASRLGVELSVISNGKCFEPPNMPLILEFQPDLQITFDGFDAESHDATRGTGNFDLITSGIKSAKQLGYNGNITARVNLHRGNISRVDDFLSTFEREFPDNELAAISVALLRKTESGGGSFDAYLETGEYLNYPDVIGAFDTWNETHSAQILYDFNNADVGCAYNAENGDVRCGLRIALDGNVFPCQMFTDDRFAIGNILGESIAGILSGNKLEKFVEAVHIRRGKIEKCGVCAFKTLCAGGCPAVAFIENGSFDSVSARCGVRKTALSSSLSQLLRAAEGKRQGASNA